MSYSVGEFGKLHPTPIYGWNVGLLDFLPAAVDGSGQLLTSGGGGGGGTVDQGAAGVDPWLVIETALALRFDGSASPLLYLGQAATGSSPASAVWQIQRFDVTTGVIDTFADGNALFDNVWNDRAGLAYS